MKVLSYNEIMNLIENDHIQINFDSRIYNKPDISHTEIIDLDFKFRDNMFNGFLSNDSNENFNNAFNMSSHIFFEPSIVNTINDNFILKKNNFNSVDLLESISSNNSNIFIHADLTLEMYNAGFRMLNNGIQCIADREFKNIELTNISDKRNAVVKNFSKILNLKLLVSS